MRGRPTRNSILKYLAVCLTATTAITMASPPASAHTPAKTKKVRRHIESRARSQIGTRYRYSGTTPNGFDCSGFTRWTFNGKGASLPHSSSAQFSLAKKNAYKRIWKRKRLKTGDLVFFKTTSANVGHAGIYVGDGKFISSTTSRGVQVDSVYDRYYWSSRWVGATRVPATQGR